MRRKSRRHKQIFLLCLMLGASLLMPLAGFASEADLAIPDLHKGAPYTLLGGIKPWDLLFYGACVIAGTLGISLFLRYQVKRLGAHESMLTVAETIFQTCRTYLIQQGKFLVMLFIFIAVCMGFYFLVLKGERMPIEAPSRTHHEAAVTCPPLERGEGIFY